MIDEVFDRETGEVTDEKGLAVPEDRDLPMQKGEFYGMSETPFSEQAQQVLLADPDPEIIEIRPDGLIYYPQVEIRRILNRAFGPGGWALRPLREMSEELENGEMVMMYEGELWCEGRFVSRAIGEHRYRLGNPSSTKATVLEAAKSDCITRCCKDLGIVADLWNPRFAKRWVEDYALKVWCDNRKGGKGKYLWRRKDDPPINQWPYQEKTDSEAVSDIPRGSGVPSPAKAAEKPSGGSLKAYYERIKELKGELLDILGSDVVYYNILGKNGLKHANDLKQKDRLADLGHKIALAVSYGKPLYISLLAHGDDGLRRAAKDVGMSDPWDLPWGDGIEEINARMQEFFTELEKGTS